MPHVLICSLREDLVDDVTHRRKTLLPFTGLGIQSCNTCWERPLEGGPRASHIWMTHSLRFQHHLLARGCPPLSMCLGSDQPDGQAVHPRARLHMGFSLIPVSGVDEVVSGVSEVADRQTEEHQQRMTHRACTNHKSLSPKQHINKLTHRGHEGPTSGPLESHFGRDLSKNSTFLTESVE